MVVAAPLSWTLMIAHAPNPSTATAIPMGVLTAVLTTRVSSSRRNFISRTSSAPCVAESAIRPNEIDATIRSGLTSGSL